ncbi:uncharacterized protein LOC131597583 [Vicia villosa]|uniref:uncharacterized protein LOC131597583 n=1 Tax=Vicia villosa TaxID=3911 RepID=UPI00273CA139|nr:uncharacterized protein LOC131597583 [Vicia villosa]
MSCYKLPEAICDEIESLVVKFWWGLRNGEQTLHWLGWEKFSSLVKKVLQGKYFPRSHIEECSVSYSPSYAWSSILSARPLIKKGSRWRIGNGENVIILKDIWIPDNLGFKVLTHDGSVNGETRVRDLIVQETGCLKQDLIETNFEPHESVSILSIPISQQNMEDKLIWHFEKDGEYSQDRNLKVFQSKDLNPMEVARITMELVFEFNKWNPEERIKNRIPECNDSNVQEVCTIQVDASVDEAGCIAFGCITRDEDRIVLSSSKVEAI